MFGMKSLRNSALAFGVMTIANLCLASAANAATSQSSDDSPPSFSGNVSWYGEKFNGRKTASGELFDMMKLTSAHLHLPFGTKVLVEDPRTGKTVIVRVNDRGPFHCKRVMDLSKGGAKQLGTLSSGVVFVDCTILSNKGS
jgi:rare lipoprotein A